MVPAPYLFITAAAIQGAAIAAFILGRFRIDKRGEISHNAA
jgi:hypothetical protein